MKDRHRQNEYLYKRSFLFNTINSLGNKMLKKLKKKLKIHSPSVKEISDIFNRNDLNDY